MIWPFGHHKQASGSSGPSVGRSLPTGSSGGFPETSPFQGIMIMTGIGTWQFGDLRQGNGLQGRLKGRCWSTGSTGDFSETSPFQETMTEMESMILAVWSPQTGEWFIRTIGGTVLANGIKWGFDLLDVPISGDFNGDGANDLAIWREITGQWFVRTIGGEILADGINLGLPNDVPIGRINLQKEGSELESMWRTKAGSSLALSFSIECFYP